MLHPLNSSSNLLHKVVPRARISTPWRVAPKAKTLMPWQLGCSLPHKLTKVLLLLLVSSSNNNSLCSINSSNNSLRSTARKKNRSAFWHCNDKMQLAQLLDFLQFRQP